MSRLLLIAVWLGLVSVLATHHPAPRDGPPAWLQQACAEVSTC